MGVDFLKVIPDGVRFFDEGTDGVKKQEEIIMGIHSVIGTVPFCKEFSVPFILYPF